MKLHSLMERLAGKTKLLNWYKNPIRSDVIDIAWPVLVELLLGSLFGMVDMMMLGRLGDNALAAASISAVGITNQPLFIGLSLVQALNVGGTAMIARYLGSKQNDRIETTLKHVMILSLVMLAIPLSILGLVFTDSIMSFMGAQADTIEAGRGYFKIVMVGFIFQALNMSISAALRGIGETKVTMKINLRANMFNVVGNAVLIYGLFGFPRLGVTGAGVSTALSNVIASTLLFTYIIKGKSIVRLNIKAPFKFDRKIVYNLIKIGGPASLEQMVLRVGVLFFAKIVAGLGTTVYAAHQIALSILGLSFQPGQAFGIAASSLVGRSLGAKKFSKAEEYAKETRRIGTMIATFMALIFFFFGPQLVGLYSQDPKIIQSASLALKIIALVQPFQSSQFILAGRHLLDFGGDLCWGINS
jgi:putative MATE family efflux protein